MNILQGMVPSHTLEHSISAMARLPKQPVAVSASAVVNRPRGYKRAQVCAYLREHPNATIAEVAKACQVSDQTVVNARAVLRAQGWRDKAAEFADKLRAAIAYQRDNPLLSEKAVANACGCEVWQVRTARRKLRAEGWTSPKRNADRTAKVLSIIREDGGADNAEIARRAGLPRSFVDYLLLRLCKAGVVRAVHRYEVVE